jgi:hypothetical protein
MSHVSRQGTFSAPHSRTSRIACRAFCAVVLCLVPRAAASQSGSQIAVQRGLSLGLEAARTSSWDVELGPPYAPRATISDAVGLALTVAYGVEPWIAPWVTYAVSLYGDSDASAVSELGGGVEFRGQWFSRFVPSVALGAGRTRAPTAGGFHFNHFDLAANGDLFVTRRLALRAGVHALRPVGDASGTDGEEPTFHVSDTRTQIRVGLRLNLGSGG